MRRLALVLLLSTAACGGDDDATDDEADAGPGDPDADLPDPDAAVAQVDPEIDGRITINEVMADNALSELDGAGEAGDWVELYNPTETDVPLHGYALSDDLTVPLKGVFPQGVELAAGARLLVWLDGQPSQGDDHLGFDLAKEGGVVTLARPDATYIDRLSYGPQATDFSLARTPDGSDAWTVEWHVSPGEANPAGDGNPAGYEDVGEDPEAAPEVGDLSERILGYDEMPEIEILVDDADLALLEAQTAGNVAYVPGTIVFDGRAYGPVGVRPKGGNSFLPFSVKPSIRINVDEYVDGAKFFQLDDLTLNNMSTDPSMMHERLAYWVARQLGVPASRCNHALVTLNGEAYGLYANVETVRRHMLGRWFSDATGALYEVSDIDWASSSSPAFELESGVDDRSLLAGAAGVLDDATPGDPVTSTSAIAAVDDFVAMTPFFQFWAMSVVVGQFDGFPRQAGDYFIYNDPTSDRIHMLPWGMDETFYAFDFDFLGVGSLDALMGRVCQDAPACLQTFADAAWDALDQVELTLGWEAERAAIAAQIAPHTLADTRKDLFMMDTANCTSQAATDADHCVAIFQGAMQSYMAARRGDFTDYLPPPSP